MSIRTASSAKEASRAARSRLAVALRNALIGWGGVESDMACRLLSAMPNYQFHWTGVRRPILIVSIPVGNRSVAFFGEQLGSKVNKHGDFAGLTAGCRLHGAGNFA